MRKYVWEYKNGDDIELCAKSSSLHKLMRYAEDWVHGGYAGGQRWSPKRDRTWTHRLGEHTIVIQEIEEVEESLDNTE